MERKLIGKILQIQDSMLSENAGLFTGDMGICLALYLLSKKGKIKQAEVEADKLLEHIIDVIKNPCNTTFDNGLAGIGWAINFLHSSNNLDGDVDEILYNIDASLYKDLTKTNAVFNISVANGLSGYLVYFTERLANSSHHIDTVQHRLIVESIQIAVDKLYELMPDILPKTSNDLYISVLWEIPFVFFNLSRIYELGIYRDKIKNVIRCWEVFIQSAIPFYNINKLYFAVSLAYMNRILKEPYIERHVDLLIHSIEFEEIESEIDLRVINMNEGWPLTVLILYFANQYIPKTQPKHMCFDTLRKKILRNNFSTLQDCLNLNSEKKVPISFINGIGGLSVAYAIWPDAFAEEVNNWGESSNLELEYHYGKRSNLRRCRC